MTDFFREVDEELRNERMRSIWKNYGKWMIAAVILLVAAVGGYRFYLYWAEKQAEASGDQYLSALNLAQDGDQAAAQAIFKNLEKEGYRAYPELARLRAAGTLLADGKTAEGIMALDALAGDASVMSDLRDYARIEAVLAAVDGVSYEELEKRTAPILASNNPWRYLAQEAMALSAWKGNRLDETAKWVGELKKNNAVPQGMRQRIRLLEELVIAAGGKIPAQDQNG
ncbi:MAG: tetratricopeptide repeat protein [Rhizobiales bacterium]|nr:tetratricopeptide repeat protein [Hyphomicrobiales bacterium]